VICLLLIASSAFVNAKLKLLNAAPKPQSAVACNACVTLMNDSEGTLLEIILDGGIIGSCEAVCSKLSAVWEQGVCTLLCAGVGIDAFITLLSRGDSDPVWVCSELGACPRNTCTQNCLTITSAWVSPAAAPVRTTFHINANITVQQQTGTGVTQVIVTPPGPVNETNSIGFSELNEGYAPGKYTISLPFATTEFDWQYPIGQYQVEIDACGSDCQDKHGVVFSTAYTVFNITTHE